MSYSIRQLIVLLMHVQHYLFKGMLTLKKTQKNRKQKHREIIALDRQGTQQQSLELPTVTPPGVRVNTMYINSTELKLTMHLFYERVITLFYGVSLVLDQAYHATR